MQLQSLRFAGQRFTVCAVELAKEPISLFWNDDRGNPFRRFDTLDRWLRERGRKLTFAMNAGMYEPDQSPVGLYVENGKTLRPLNRRTGSGNFYLMPNGVFALTQSGAVVSETSRFAAINPERVRWATQSGPLLLQNGRLHPAFRAGSKNRQIRNGVGIVSSKRVVFAISEEPVNFYDFATLFRDQLHCTDALYFDGYVSALFAPTLRRNDHRRDLGPIVAITTRA